MIWPSCFGMNARSYFCRETDSLACQFSDSNSTVSGGKDLGMTAWVACPICQIGISEKRRIQKPGLRFKKDGNLVDGRLENWVSEGKTFQFELEERIETDYNWCCCAFVAEKNGFQEDWIQSRSDRASKPDRWKAEPENVRLNKSVIVRNRANADLAKNLINAHFSGKDAQERVLLCETVLVHFAAGWRRPGFLCADGKRVIELNTQGKEVNLAIPSDMPEDVRMEMGIGLHILESRQSQTDLNWGGQNQCKLYLDSKKDQELGAYPNRKADRIFRINEGRNVSRPVRPCL